MVLYAIIKPTALIGILLSSHRLRNTPGLAFPLRAYKMLMSNTWINIDRTASASIAADLEASRNCADYLRLEYFNPMYVCEYVCMCVHTLVKYSTYLHLALFANILLTKRITTRIHFHDKHLLKRTSSVHSSSYGQHWTDRREKRQVQRDTDRGFPLLV